MTPENTGTPAEEVAARLILAFGRGDRDGVLAELADTAEIRMPAAPRGAERHIADRDGIAALVGHVSTTWKSVEITRLRTTALVGSTDRVLAEYAIEGVNLDDTVYRNEYVTLVTVRDDKVTSFTEYFDPDPIVGSLDALREHLGLPRTG